MHGSITSAKAITKAYYAGDINFSYYASCSTGGRQGLKEIQLNPESFDGVIVGAPAWWTTHLQTWTLKQGLTNFPASTPSYIPPNLFQTIANEMIKQCDTQDGVRDGIVADPFGCNFDFNQLLCRPGQNTTTCLTMAQIETAQKLYSPYLDANQTLLFPGITLGTSAAALSAKPSGLGIDFLQDWIFNDTNWDFTTFDIKDVGLADMINPGGATADDFDLSPFEKRGGKLIHYHGLADNLIPSGSSQYFYNQVYRTLTAKGLGVDDFYRFFFIPGMGHCSGAPVAPWYIGGGNQHVAGASHSVPGFADPKHDVIMAIMAWVEQGKAPDQLIATKFRNDTVSSGVESQRPLCPYPKQAQYVGHGDTNRPDSWKCVA